MTVPFIPTQRVVCRQELPHWTKGGVVGPKKGGVYTVRAIVIGNDSVGGRAQCVKLDEVVNSPVRNGTSYGEPVWESSAFAAVDESRLDIFRRMLVEPPQPWGRG